MILNTWKGRSLVHLNHLLHKPHLLKSILLKETNMKQFFLLIPGLLSLLSIAQGQDSTIGIPTEQFLRKYSFFADQTISHPLNPTTQYSSVEGGARVTNGGYMLKQDAPSMRSVFFETLGTKQVGKYKVNGSFSFSRTIKDSVAFTLREGVLDPSPYYFFSFGKGNWEINRYKLHGVVSRDLVENKLTVAAGAFYTTLNAWRSNDPRTDQFEHALRGELALLYKPHRNHSFGVGGGILLDTKENSNEYRNKDYQSNQLFVNYTNYIQYGYGLGQKYTTGRSIESRGPGWEINGVYQANSSLGSITIKGELAKRETGYFRNPTSTATAKYIYGNFQETTTSWEGLWVGPKKMLQQWQLHATYKKHTGKDFHEILQANNYVYHNEKFCVTPSFLHLKNNKPKYELMLHGDYNDLARSDGSSAHYVRNKTIAAGLTGVYYFSFKNGSVLKAGVGATLRKKLSADMELGESQETEFSRQVVYSDFYYYAADALQANLDVAYYLKVKKRQAFAKVSLLNQDAEIEKNVPSYISKPGSNRFMWQLSIGIGL